MMDAALKHFPCHDDEIFSVMELNPCKSHELECYVGMHDKGCIREVRHSTPFYKVQVLIGMLTLYAVLQ